jgi:hypothetical protein
MHKAGTFVHELSLVLIGLKVLLFVDHPAAIMSTRKGKLWCDCNIPMTHWLCQARVATLRHAVLQVILGAHF